MGNRKIFILFLFSGILLGFAWSDYLPSFLVFIALVPVLIAENELFNNNASKTTVKTFIYSLIAFFIWNIISFWWAWQPSIWGLLSPLIVNTLLYSVMFTVYHAIHKKLGDKFGYFTLFIFWIGTEYLHHKWDLAFPWLTLGNASGMYIKIIQWYEFTGVFGGTLWVLLINYFIFKIISDYTASRKQIIIIYNVIKLKLIIIIPIIISIIIFNKDIKSLGERQVLLIQPNINPNTEKFDKYKPIEQLNIMLDLADAKIDSTIDYVIFPETALSKFIKERNLDNDEQIKPLKTFLKKHDQLNLITGAFTIKQFDTTQTIPVTASRVGVSPYYYDHYNSMIMIDTNKINQIYHKTQLLPGAEKMPFFKSAKFLEKLKVDIAGGITWYGSDNDTWMLKSTYDTVRIAPIICWESVFGSYTASQVGRGTHFIVLITNDGWWGNTAGHRIHMKYAKIRAIETRRTIARCANTGISCFINPKGEIISQTKYDEKVSLKGDVNIYNRKTFYTMHGDIIGRISLFLSVLFLLYYIVKTRLKTNV